MPINPDAVGTKSDPHTVSWTPRDCVIYALGVGAGTDELQFSTWDTGSRPQQVLPTFADVAGGGKVGTTEVTGIYDKGSGAVVTMEGTAVDPSSGDATGKTSSPCPCGWTATRRCSGPRRRTVRWSSTKAAASSPDPAHRPVSPSRR